MILPYHKIYAKRHNLSAIEVAKSEWADLAAFLEFQTGVEGGLRLTVLEARKRFVEQYPDSNCSPWNNPKKSVINIIKPYENSIREIPNIRQINCKNNLDSCIDMWDNSQTNELDKGENNND